MTLDGTEHTFGQPRSAVLAASLNHFLPTCRILRAEVLREKLSLDTVQAVLSKSKSQCGISTVSVTNPKHSPTEVAMMK